MNIVGKDTRRKCVALVVCLFIAVNSVQGMVLCFGADGHIEFESAFHEQCTDHDHSSPADHSHRSSEADHEEDRHCHDGQCVDVPVDVGLAGISKTTEQLDRASAAICADVIVSAGQPDCFECSPASNVCFATSYFNPLRTIILLA